MEMAFLVLLQTRWSHFFQSWRIDARIDAAALARLEKNLPNFDAQD